MKRWDSVAVSIIACVAVMVVAVLLLVASTNGGNSVRYNISDKTISPGTAREYEFTRGAGESNITFYLHNRTTTVPGMGSQLIMNSTYPNSTGHYYTASPASSFTLEWYIMPYLTGPTTLYGDVILRIYVAGAGVNNKPTISFNLYNYTPGVGSDLITSGSYDIPLLKTGVNPYFIHSTISNPYTLQTNSYIRLEFTLTGNAATGNDWSVYWGNSSYPSLLKVSSTNHLKIGDGWIEDNAHNRTIKLDPSGANSTTYINMSATDPYGIDDISWVNVSIISPDGEVVVDHAPMTLIYGSNTSYYANYSYTWNYSGYPTGVYTVYLYAVDNSGYYYRFPANPGDETFGGHLQTFTFTFTIGESVYVNTLTQDSSGNPLEGAILDIRTTGGMQVTTATVGVGGLNNITMTTGTYVFNVLWQDVVVFNGTFGIANNINESTPLLLNASVYNASVLTLDADGFPMRDTSLYITHPNGSANIVAYTTNASGIYSMYRTAGGVYRIDVFWRGVLVNTTTINISSDGLYIINTSVFRFTVNTTDVLGAPLTGAQVVLTNASSGDIFDSQITGESGIVVSQLPAGTYRLDVYWQGVPVYRDAAVQVVNTSSYTAMCDVYYLNITAVDSRNVSVIGAQITILTSGGSVLDSQVTDSTGTVKMRLPAGIFSLRVQWRNILVNSSDNLHITSNTPITVNCSIEYLSLTVVDSHPSSPQPLAFARVSFTYNGMSSPFQNAETDSNGFLEVRLPAGTYDISVSWMDVEVYTASGYSVSMPEQEDTITCNVFYVNISAVDGYGDPLYGAVINVYFNSTHRLVGSGSIGEAESFTLRLPSTTYDLDVYWLNIKVGGALAYLPSGNENLQLDCAVYYLNITALDTHGVPLSGAQVEVEYNGNTLAVDITDDNGTVVAYLPGAYLDIYVTYNGHPVGVRHNVLPDPHLSAIDIPCNVFYLTLNLSDSKGYPVDGAVVKFTDEFGNVLGLNTSSDTGSLTIRLPSGIYNISVSWLGVNVAEVDGYSVGSVVDPVLSINCSIHYLTINASDSHGIPVIGAPTYIYLNSTHHLMFSEMTDTSGHTVARLPASAYDIVILWNGVEVYKQTDYSLTSSTDIDAACSIFYVVFSLVDSQGYPVADATVTAYLSDGGLLSTGGTDSSGNITFRLPQSHIDLSVVWKGILVNESFDVLVSGDGHITVECSIYYLTVTAVDSLGSEALPYAHVSAYLPNSTAPMASGRCDINGVVVLRLPGADYLLDVSWRDIPVMADFAVNLTSDDSVTVSCRVYYLTLNVKDMSGKELASANILVVEHISGKIMGEGISNNTGSFTFRLPGCSYDIKVMWLGHSVYYESSYSLEDNTDKTVTASVFYLTVHAVDSMNISIPNASITVRSGITGETLGGLSTNTDGNCVFRLPAGPLEFSVVWMHITVLSAMEYSLDGDSANPLLDLPCSVYYTTIMVVDDRSLPVKDANIIMYSHGSGYLMGRNSTSDEGIVTVRLPAGEYDAYTSWMNTIVNSTVFSVSKNVNITVTADVFYLTLLAVDDISNPIPDAVCTIVSHSGAIFSGVSDENGSVTVRAPAESYAITLRWMNMPVYSGDYTLNSSATVTLKCTVYYLTVKVEDSTGSAVSSAKVAVVSEDALWNITMDTPRNGTVVFRLPGGNYSVFVRYTTTYMMSPVDTKKSEHIQLDSSMEISLTLRNYPPSTTNTAAFRAAAFSIIFLLLVGAILFFLFARTKKSSFDTGYPAEGDISQPVEDESSERPSEEMGEELGDEELDDEGIISTEDESQEYKIEESIDTNDESEYDIEENVDDTVYEDDDAIEEVEE